MNFKQLIPSILCLVFLIFISCSTTKQSVEMNFIKIIIGNGGGATGFQNGFTIDTSGNLYSWSGRMTEDNLKFKGSVSKDTLQSIWHLIQNNGLIELNYQSPNNFYNFIKIETIDKKNYIVWNPLEKNDTTKLINEIFKELMKIINNVK